MIALDLITSALRKIGVLAVGEIPSGDDAAVALAALQELISSWNTDRLNIFTIKIELFSLVASKQAYTIGVGGEFDTARPVEITKGNIILPTNPTVRLPMEPLNDEQWGNIRVKSVAAIPYQYYYDRSYSPLTPGPVGLARLYFFPLPNQILQVELFDWQALATPVLLADDLAYPPGYGRTLIHNLAIELCPDFGRTAPPEVVAIAVESKRMVNALNAPSPLMVSDPALQSPSRRSQFNYLSGQ